MSAVDKLIEAALAAEKTARNLHIEYRRQLATLAPEDCQDAYEEYLEAFSYSEGLNEALGIFHNYREAEAKAKKPNPESCGGCAGLGSHIRFCAAIWGKTAQRLGDLVEELGSMGDNAAPAEANILWKLEGEVTIAALKASANYRRNLPEDTEATS